MRSGRYARYARYKRYERYKRYREVGVRGEMELESSGRGAGVRGLVGRARAQGYLSTFFHKSQDRARIYLILQYFKL